MALKFDGFIAYHCANGNKKIKVITQWNGNGKEAKESTYMSWKSEDSVSTPSYCAFAQSSCAVTRKNICVAERFKPGKRAIDFDPLKVRSEWYAICIPPDVINNSIRLEFENTSTAVGTQRIALSSKAFVTDRKISFAIVMPTVEKCKYGGRVGWKNGTRINDNGTTVWEKKEIKEK